MPHTTASTPTRSRPPESSRIAWASAHARGVWEPRIHAINDAWLDVELLSVAEGDRAAALFFGDTKTAEALKLTVVGVAPNRWVATRKRADADEFVAAYAAGNDLRIGEFLGFPECCRHFFHDVWNVKGRMDTTPFMGKGDLIGANILHRWAGVRFVPHLPCSFGCEPTQFVAERLSALWPAEEWTWAHEVLNWPVRYSALHGAAIITTPIYKVVASTDYTPAEVRIDRPGTVPSEAPKGLTFPFTQPRVLQIQGLKRALPQMDPRTWTDNGWPTREAMDVAHRDLLAHVPAGARSAIDFGAGNGLLLEKGGFEVAVGIEHDAERAARGRAAGRDVRHLTITRATRPRYGDPREPVVTGRFDVGFISQRRFEEMSYTELSQFVGWVKAHVRTLVIYSYDEPRFVRRVNTIEWDGR